MLFRSPDEILNRQSMKTEIPLVQLEKVSKVYEIGPVKVQALREVTLNIEKGEHISVMGPSGSGKSTLMNLVGCLDRPTSGTYFFEGENVGRLSDDRLAKIRNRQIGFVFQNYNLLSRSTALINVNLPLLYAGRKDPARVVQVLEEVGLTDRMDHIPTQLSGGQQQRVAIARALVNEPSMILADEPTGNLDRKSGEEILNIFRNLNTKGITVIVVTHDPEIASRADRTVVFLDGEIISDRRNGSG